MVFFGHVGVTLGAGLLARATAGRIGGRKTGFFRTLDLRWLMLGSLLPDIIDKPLIFLFPESTIGGGRAIGHSLLIMVLLFLSVLTIQGWTRLALLTVLIGALGHLALDSMWKMPETLLWPLMGWGFYPIDPEVIVPHIVRDLTTKPLLYLPEAMGFVISLCFAAYLLATRKVRSFLTRGKL